MSSSQGLTISFYVYFVGFSFSIVIIFFKIREEIGHCHFGNFFFLFVVSLYLLDFIHIFLSSISFVLSSSMLVSCSL